MHTFNKSLIDVYESAQHCGLLEFNQYAFGELKKLIAFDSCGLADLELTPRRKVVVQTVYLDSTPAERLQDRSQSLGQEAVQENGAISSQDGTLLNAFKCRGQSVIADIAATSDDPRLLSYCRKYETAHSLAFVSDRSFGRSVPILGLWRGSRRNPYTGQHSHDANLFIPHLLQAREINRRFWHGVERGPSQGGMVLASLQGQVYFIDDDTIRLVQTEWKEWAPPFLPRALLQALESTSAKLFVGQRITVRARMSGTMFFLSVSMNADRRMSLTPAELRVAMLAAQGMQYKEIARKADVAPATVRNQLHSVYRKLGVSNKTALAAALRAGANDQLVLSPTR